MKLAPLRILREDSIDVVILAAEARSLVAAKRSKPLPLVWSMCRAATCAALAQGVADTNVMLGADVGDWRLFRLRPSDKWRSLPPPFVRATTPPLRRGEWALPEGCVGYSPRAHAVLARADMGSRRLLWHVPWPGVFDEFSKPSHPRARGGMEREQWGGWIRHGTTDAPVTGFGGTKKKALIPSCCDRGTELATVVPLSRMDNLFHILLHVPAAVSLWERHVLPRLSAHPGADSQPTAALDHVTVLPWLYRFPPEIPHGRWLPQPLSMHRAVQRSVQSAVGFPGWELLLRALSLPWPTSHERSLRTLQRRNGRFGCHATLFGGHLEDPLGSPQLSATLLAAVRLALSSAFRRRAPPLPPVAPQEDGRTRAVGSSVLLLVRRGPRSRHITNEGELRAALSREPRLSGRVAVVSLENTSLRYQWQTTSSASGVVAVHGQACAWVALLQPGSWMLEILPESIRSCHTTARQYYSVLARAGGVNHAELLQPDAAECAPRRLNGSSSDERSAAAARAQACSAQFGYHTCGNVTVNASSVRRRILDMMGVSTDS